MMAVELSPSLARYVLVVKGATDQGRILRQADLARMLGVSRPSVSKAMGRLEDAGLVAPELRKRVFLTEEGNRVADDLESEWSCIAKAFAGLPESDAACGKLPCLRCPLGSGSAFDRAGHFSGI